MCEEVEEHAEDEKHDEDEERDEEEECDVKSYGISSLRHSRRRGSNIRQCQLRE